MRASDDITCEFCGATACRGRNGKAYWSTRRYCSNDCHTKARAVARPALFWSKVQIGVADECWPWTAGVDKDGYGQTRYLTKDESAHRVAYRLACGPIPDGHMVERGRAVKRCGELNTRAVLDEEMVRLIYADRRDVDAIAADHGISRWTVYDIRSGRSWPHLRLAEAAQ